MSLDNQRIVSTVLAIIQSSDIDSMQLTNIEVVSYVGMDMVYARALDENLTVNQCSLFVLVIDNVTEQAALQRLIGGQIIISCALHSNLIQLES